MEKLDAIAEKHLTGLVSTSKHVVSPREDILYFPRRKLKMSKQHGSEGRPLAWFIRGLLEDESTGLSCSTDETGVGLRSGLRGAIVRESDGSYLKLKGVYPAINRPSRGTPKDWGLCTIKEACDEQKIVVKLLAQGFESSALRPTYVEIPFRQNPLSYIVERHFLRNSEKVQNELEIFKSESNDFGISAFKISGDTRLDEAFFHLTSRRLSGDRKSERDEIMKYLSFNAGAALASLNLRDYCWSPRLDATNSHLGNFVIDATHKNATVKMADFYAACRNPDSISFWRYMSQDVTQFGDDFYADVTTSLPRDLAFRHFSNRLRAVCFDAFKTGYFAVLKRDREIPSQMLDVDYKVVLPERRVISRDELRQRINYVMGNRQ